ncbi:phosphorylase [Adhaeribacter arboris]|uniref:Uridine phosphorylase n=1 Tax=Adhaeribacter arboris TaxID=2072846 RepID=A0A2T2YKX1_9BACT|nr:nucleoside phosphorylase [Adhaeribacter arboris]PSR56151.1 phosphorylase [Adhaeribacter arboris]
MPIAESELILNADGSVYHLNLLPEHISDTIITVGDPERVPRISKYFDSIEVEIAKREFVTHTGYYKGKRLTVLSTGMGTDNVEIVMNELDALVNIDLVSREVTDDPISLKIIRIGTSGSLQESIPVGSHLVTEYAIGLDPLMQFYPFVQTGYENTISSALQESLQLGYQPYCVKGSDILREQLGKDLITGNTLTCPGFYAPQGRVLRLELKDADLVTNFNRFKVDDFWLTNFEMETAGYYALGVMLGHEVVSLNAIVVNRITKQFDPNAEQTVENLITKTLDRLVAIS